MANVVLKNLTKEFKTHDGTKIFKAVDEISLEINAGEFVTLLGPSGCGKTTILRMIAGFEEPTMGDVILGGKKINDDSPDKRDTAMVFQSYALFPHYNVYDNIAYGLKNKNLSDNIIQEKVKNILEIVGLKDLEARNTNQLSGGQQQRVALARALVMEPAVLLFDEPLSNLDAKLRVYMRREIRKIQKRIGLTSVYVTHDQSEAMSLSDKIIIMNKGKIEQIGSPMEIYQRPATEFVAEFIGIANFATGVVASVEKQTVQVKIFDELFPAVNNNFRVGDEVLVVIRPEAVSINRASGIPAKIISSTYMGPLQEYVLSINDREMSVEDSNPAGKEIFAEGEEVRVLFQNKNLHAIKKGG